MREIKFRQAIAAIAEVPFHWHYWGYINKDSEGIPMFTGPIGIMSRDRRPSYQFTGLKDKNGKEYYFDDVSKWNNKLWVVVWSQTLASIQLQPVNNYYKRLKNPATTRLYGPTFGLGQANASENIGNIHENNELLEEKSND